MALETRRRLRLRIHTHIFRTASESGALPRHTAQRRAALSVALRGGQPGGTRTDNGGCRRGIGAGLCVAGPRHRRRAPVSQSRSARDRGSGRGCPPVPVMTLAMTRRAAPRNEAKACAPPASSNSRSSIRCLGSSAGRRTANPGLPLPARASAKLSKAVCQSSKIPESHARSVASSSGSPFISPVLAWSTVHARSPPWAGRYPRFPGAGDSARSAAAIGLTGATLTGVTVTWRCALAPASASRTSALGHSTTGPCGARSSRRSAR